jgi:hypothetical protein
LGISSGLSLDVSSSFESASPSVVKAIKQRDLLNTWLRLYARERKIPAISEYRPERLEDELPDLVYFDVDSGTEPPQITIQSDGTRISVAYGHTGKGRALDDYIGARLAPFVMPIYYECVRRALPVYTIAHIDDIMGESSPMSGWCCRSRTQARSRMRSRR